MNTLDIAWAAGILEGEGSFVETTNRANIGLCIKLGMTDEDVVRRMHSIFNCGNVTGPYSYGNKKWKPCWRWDVGRQEQVAAILMTIFQFMGNRRQKTIKGMLRVWRDQPVLKKRRVV